MTPFINICDVSARTPTGRLLFRNVNLTIRAGDIIGITGPSGCGKSTLLAWLANAMPLANRVSGRVTRAPTVDHPARPDCNFVPQGAKNFFLPLFSADATIRLLLDTLPDVRRRPTSERINSFLKEFDLTPHVVRRSPVAFLSGGETQRAALAITLAFGPAIWIADEPTASLDQKNKARLLSLLRACKSESTTMLIASHDAKFLRAISDKQLRLTPSGLEAETFPRLVNSTKDCSPSAEEPALSLRDISYGYRIGAWNKRWVLRNLSGDYHRSLVYGVVGPSGSGKSTLLRLIAGFDKPWRGHVSWAESTPRNQRVALLVPQEARQFFNPSQPIGTFVQGLAKGRDFALDQQSLIAQVEELGLDRRFLQMRPNEPSGGEAQRLALAAALWLKPNVLCLDEIDSGLDHPNKEIAARRIRHHARSNREAIIVTTHDLEFAKAACDFVLSTEDNNAFVA